jgi:RimJ/RimL family protein N-acetyltransferase
MARLLWEDRRRSMTRVQLVPATADHVRALIAGDDAFTEQFGLAVSPGYLEFDGVLEHFLTGLDAGADPAWHTQLVVERKDRTLIGLGGFKGPPADGMVEIGYGISPAYRNRGYATEAARLMVETARAAGVRTVIAHTRPEPNHSTRLLTTLGFTQTTTVDDPDEGPVWRWELPLA